MRILIVVPLAALAAACNVSTDNNAVTVQYDQNTAANAIADVGNTAQDIGNAVSNEASETANKVDNSSIVANDEDQNKAAPENRQ
jgi:hypothetical protein